MSDLSWLNPTPHAIAVYASRPLSPVATQHSLPSGRYPLLGPDLHRLDRTSLRLAKPLDHLVGGHEQTGRHAEAERSSRLQIDNKLELGRLCYRQVSGLFPLEDAANIDPVLAKRIGHVCSIAHQSASFGVVAIGIGRGNPVSSRQSGKLHASAVEEKLGGDEQRFGTLARHRGESRIDLAAVARVEDLDF